jgi:hypothetical protein
VKRCPAPHEGECEIEIRQVYEMEDFGPEMSERQRRKEEAIRAQIGQK